MRETLKELRKVWGGGSWGEEMGGRLRVEQAARDIAKA